MSGLETLWDAVERLHQEAHGEDKMPFRMCTRRACRDIHESMDEYTYELEYRYRF